MEQNLFVYNTLTRRKELFKPLQEPNVGMYVCGPTVYGDPHLGHARPAITFDVLFRYLKHLGYKVRYVRNITDVGHLEHDADEGEDKIAKKARLEQLEPMEVAQYYTNRYHAAMEALNVLPPSIEPHATGHIIEQQQLVKEIMANGYAYESNGSIYFDVEKYNRDHHYGKLSGRNLDDVKNASRELDGVGEKRNQADFALWKKAQPEHIMRWPSPWSDGFPGWHCECTAMGRKYLGNHFDIHGGGMDLVFPHHECEIAQAVASQGDDMVHYWMHNNMITINGQKMGKSLGNFITLEQFFTGDHELLTQAYSPMTIRFFILQAHYRGTVDFSNEALQGRREGLRAHDGRLAPPARPEACRHVEHHTRRLCHTLCRSHERRLEHAGGDSHAVRRLPRYQSGERRKCNAHTSRHRHAKAAFQHLRLRRARTARRCCMPVPAASTWSPITRLLTCCSRCAATPRPPRTGLPAT